MQVSKVDWHIFNHYRKNLTVNNQNQRVAGTSTSTALWKENVGQSTDEGGVGHRVLFMKI